MRAGWYERKGAAREVIEIGETATPEPGAGEIRVRLHASGVNPTDCKRRGGQAQALAGCRPAAAAQEVVPPGVAPGKVPFGSTRTTSSARRGSTSPLDGSKRKEEMLLLREFEV